MRKKSDESDVITKDYLDDRLDNFKGEIKNEFADFKGEIRGEFVVQEDRLERKIDDSISKAMSKFYTRIDPILAEVENARLDRELTTEQLRKLDKRVTKLENAN